jgi:hypothetical protein
MGGVGSYPVVSDDQSGDLIRRSSNSRNRRARSRPGRSSRQLRAVVTGQQQRPQPLQHPAQVREIVDVRIDVGDGDGESVRTARAGRRAREPHLTPPARSSRNSNSSRPSQYMATATAQAVHTRRAADPARATARSTTRGMIPTVRVDGVELAVRPRAGPRRAAASLLRSAQVSHCGMPQLTIDHVKAFDLVVGARTIGPLVRSEGCV